MSSSAIFILILLVVLTSADEVFLGIEQPVQQKTTTHIRVYLHDLVSGPNATVARIDAGPSYAAAVNFGNIAVFDDKLTTGPGESSEVVGRGQGSVTGVSLSEAVIYLHMDFLFTAGEYSGSSLTLLGRNPHNSAKFREIPIVGGTGVFRLARGYAITRTYYQDDATNNAILQYDLYVMHGTHASII